MIKRQNKVLMFDMLRQYLQHLKDDHGLSFRRIIIRHYLPHFLSSGLVGLLVYWLTLTTLSHINSARTIGLPINILSWLLALSFSVVVHILEDFSINKF